MKKKLGLLFAVVLFGGAVLAQNMGVKGLRFVAPTTNGTPESTVAYPERGEIVFDAINAVFKGFNGTTWNTMDNTGNVVPTGTISSFAGDTAPPGWALCDGSELDRTDYVDLYNVIGVRFGPGNGVTTFDLPDLRGVFLRGRDNMGGTAAGRDTQAASRLAMVAGGAAGSNVGSIQMDQLKAHTHTTTLPTYGGSGILGAGARFSGANTSLGNATSTSDSAGGVETRPINVYVNYIIKL